MSKAWERGMALAAAAVCLALLAGCGGGGDGGRANLEAQLATLEEEKKQADADLKKAQDDLAARNATLDAINTRLAKLEEDEDDDDTATPSTTHAGLFLAGDDNGDNGDDDMPAGGAGDGAGGQQQQQTTGGANTLAANALSQELLNALESKYATDGAVTLTPASTPVTIRTPATGTSTVRVTKDGGYTVSSFSAPTGYTGKKFTRTSVGKETIVVITDLEPSRRVLDHHFDQREGDDDTAKRSATRLVVDTGVPFEASRSNIIASDSQIKISHGFPPKQTTTEQTLKTPTTISGQVYPATSTGGTTTYKVFGRFECGGVPGCEVRLTPTYGDEDSDQATPDTLTGVALAVSDKDGVDATGAVLYFRPSTASIPLDGSILVGTTGLVDGQYMTFGYWLTEPSTPNGDYTYQVFGNAVTSGTLGDIPISASFAGSAVGVYVEQGAGTDLSKRQGQFTAAINLTATTAGELGGKIGNFQTTAAGGSSAATTSQNWLVDLGSVAAGTLGSARITNLPGSSQSQGGWQFSLVGNHGNEDSNDNPSAAVGVFDTRIEDLLHLSGAFGASRD